MQTQANVSVQSPNHGSRAAVLSFFEQRPVLSAVMIFLVYLTVATLFGLAAKAIFPQYQPDFVALIGMSVVIALALSALGWWKAAGFNFPTEWRELPLDDRSVPYRVGVAFSQRHQNDRRRHFRLSPDRLCPDRFHGRRFHARHRPARAQTDRHNSQRSYLISALWVDAYRQPALSKSIHRVCSNDRSLRPWNWSQCHPPAHEHDLVSRYLPWPA